MMTQPFSITLVEADTITPGMLLGLSELLLDAIADGASVGWLSLPSTAEADDYWLEVKTGVAQGKILLWVAETAGQVVGTVQLHLTAKENGKHRAEIARLLVHTGGRRQGIGGRLMTAVEEEAWRRDLSLLVLDTREGDPSQALYTKLGWQLAGVIPQFARSTDGRLAGTALMYKLSTGVE